jgi:hypothetical protein
MRIVARNATAACKRLVAAALRPYCELGDSQYRSVTSATNAR